MNEIKNNIFDAIKSLLEDKSSEISDSTPLLGDGSVLNSMRLVELCLALEDLALSLDFEFDWTSDVAMSKSKSMFRSAGALANEFASQMEDQVNKVEL